MSVESEYVEQNPDRLLLETLPGDFEQITCKAAPVNWTRKAGLGNLGIRALPFLYARVVRYLKDNPVDLIFFTTTVFVSMALGPVLKRRFGVPFVLDMQDPWRNDYYLTIPKADRPMKFWFNYRLQSFLEARTMPYCDGLISVSKGYIDDLQQRYPALQSKPAETIPFSVLRDDLEVASSLAYQGFSSDEVNIVYVGRGGKDLRQAFEAIFEGFASLLERTSDSSQVRKIRFHCFGTSYAAKGKGEKTIEPVAEKYGVQNYVSEQTDRLNYFDALSVLMAADVILVPGSNDLNYTASKLYPYVLTKKPLIVVAHEETPLVLTVREIGVGEIVALDDSNQAASSFADILEQVVSRIPFEPDCNWEVFKKYEAPAMTRRVCQLFEKVLK